MSNWQPQQYVRQNGNPVGFDDEGNLTDLITGEKGSLVLPEFTYRKIREFYPTAISNFYKELIGDIEIPEIVHSTKPQVSDEVSILKQIGAIQNKYGDWVYMNPYYKKAILQSNPYYVFDRDDYERVYNNKQLIDAYDRESNSKRIGKVEKIKRLFGKSNSLYIKECAKAANIINFQLGFPTTGNAWTRQGIYGDSLIFDNPDLKYKWDTHKRNLSKLDISNLLTGDFVDIYYPGSRYQDQADTGRGNSHTGNIIKSALTGEVYVVDNTGTLHVRPIKRMLNNEESDGTLIMRIFRPGTKINPYK